MTIPELITDVRTAPDNALMRDWKPSLLRELHQLQNAAELMARRGQRALNGDSNDAEHDALFLIVQLLAERMLGK